MDTTMLDASDGEYEYEYGSEIETFYLNLDLTAHHGAVRPPRRRTPAGDAESMNEVQTSADNNDDNRASEAFTPIETAEGGSLSNERIQILDLHTCNPIVSYHNQMFTCSWADQIGTELVFASPNTEPGTNQSTEPLHRGPSFELIAANSVKILGRKAHITSSSGPGLVQNSQAETPTTNPASEATSQAPSQAGVPRRVAPPSHQAQFLKRLQDLKSAKGEGDTVRTVMSTRRTLHSADHLERLQGWTRTEAQLAEIQRLNERAARGDAEAQTTLNMMISGLQTESESESESGSSTS